MPWIIDNRPANMRCRIIHAYNPVVDHMSLASGSRVGVYEVVTPIGVGGMGEVYRARDTTLGRDVAIKILPEAVAADPDRIARFAREAQLLAALNHQNIAHVYGSEESGRSRALVMELVEGPTLADRLREGPIPLDESLAIATQILDALDAAHSHGIVHRDLKPANIKVRPDGVVKVLDFGLAKAIEGTADAERGQLANSPTITSPAMSMRGVILGTAAYMAPEQAKGEPVDKRADMWAFGCVLFEMLSGRRAFDGEDIAETLAAVLTRSPEWGALPGDVPPSVRSLLLRCCEKDPKRRVPDSSVARWMLADATLTPALPARSTGRQTTTALVVAVIAVFAAIGFAFARWNGPPIVNEPVRRFSIELGADVGLLPITNVGGVQRGVGASVAVSPDGQYLALVGRRGEGPSHLYLRALDQLSARALPGTEDAAAPFFSPDGQWVAFFAEGKLKKVLMSGGVPITLCEVLAGRGGTWGDDGNIVFTSSGQPGATLMRVAAVGGSAEPLTHLLPGEATHRWPQSLPDRAGVLFTASSSNTGPYDAADPSVVPIEGGSHKAVHKGGSHGRYVPSGHLLFVNGGTLFVVPFDLKQLATTGPPVPVLEGVSYSSDNGASQFAVSATGVLTYVVGVTGSVERTIDWVDRTGRATPLRPTPGVWSSMRFSPDGDGSCSAADCSHLARRRLTSGCSIGHATS